MAYVEGLAFCSSVLPWRSCGNRPPWLGARHVDKTAHAVRELVEKLPRDSLVWGGDWNHALSGREWSGSNGGRGHILRALDELGLRAATSALPHAIDGLLSIDHIALNAAREVRGARRISAAVDGQRLSDHDA